MKRQYGFQTDEKMADARTQFSSLEWTRSNQLPRLINAFERLQHETLRTQAPITNLEMAIHLIRKCPPEWSEFVNALRAQGPTLTANWLKLKQALESEWGRRQRARENNRGNPPNNDNRNGNHNGDRSANNNASGTPKNCTNCAAVNRRGAKTHNFEDCYFPGGGKAGQFPPNFCNKARYAPGQQQQPPNDGGRLYATRTMTYAQAATRAITTTAPHTDFYTEYKNMGTTPNIETTTETHMGTTPTTGATYASRALTYAQIATRGLYTETDNETHTELETDNPTMKPLGNTPTLHQAAPSHTTPSIYFEYNTHTKQARALATKNNNKTQASTQPRFFIDSGATPNTSIHEGRTPRWLNNYSNVERNR